MDNDDEMSTSQHMHDVMNTSNIDDPAVIEVKATNPNKTEYFSIASPSVVPVE